MCGKFKEWKAGHDPKKFTYGCYLSVLTGFGDIPPEPTFHDSYNENILKKQGRTLEFDPRTPRTCIPNFLYLIFVYPVSGSLGDIDQAL